MLGRWFCSRNKREGRVPGEATFPRTALGVSAPATCAAIGSGRRWRGSIAAGLVSGPRMAIDASLIEPDASKQNATPKEGRTRHAFARLPPGVQWASISLRRVRRLWARPERCSQVHLTFRPRQPMPLVRLLRNAMPVVESSSQAPCSLELFRQLPDRHRSRRHCRSRSHPLNRAGRGWIDKDDAEACALRSMS